jgi:hypothetical protein
MLGLLTSKPKFLDDFESMAALGKRASTPQEAFQHYLRVRDEIGAWVETLPESLERTRQAASV